MDYGDYYWGLYRDYYRDPFPHCLLSTRELSTLAVSTLVFLGVCVAARGPRPCFGHLLNPTLFQGS